MGETYNPTWDLDVIFKGGSESATFRNYLNDTKGAIEALATLVEQFRPDEVANNVASFRTVLEKLEKTLNQLRECGAFISCLSAQDVHDEHANLLVAERSALGATLRAITTAFHQKLIEINDANWKRLLEHESIVPLQFVLNEYREEAKENLPLEQEMLVNDLAVDGYHGWGQMYDAIVGNMTVDLEENGEVKTYSVGQAANKLSDPNRDIRREAFHTLEKAWEAQANLFAQTLNHLAGFRLNMYKHRGWDDVLKEPLQINRMEKATLDAMWGAIERNKELFVQFLHKKAALLGLEKLSMYDITAPITETVEKKDYTSGAKFIIEHFRAFSPKMADFAEMAFENRWIEAEDREGKRPGGFCTSFPDSKQTRIFMTYSGTATNISTLAHELGHAYHQYVMDDLNGLNQRYAMNVAETASTFAEMIVADASVQHAQTKEEKLALLEGKIQSSIAFFMNIHSRFIFERAFYEERKQGMVSATRLNELMEEAQAEAYAGAIENSDPTFWASKLHFHITGVPFYNFPYTFGYLFSLGIYAYAQKRGESFEDEYIALLRDTGKMTVEELAQKHLNVDLTEPDFWEDAIALCVADVEQFLAL